MTLFILSMPNVGSWNGKWTGSENVYAKTRKLSKAAEERVFKGADDADFFYDFGDGWCARVSAKNVPAAEANKIMRRSRGFCGYDWMIEEIISLGRSVPRSERTE